MNDRRGGPTTGFVLGTIALLAALLLAPLPKAGRLGTAIQDLGHVPLAIVLVLVLYRWARARPMPHAGAALAALAATTVLLGGMEVLQAFVGRGRSWGDLRAGVLAAMGALAFLPLRGRTRPLRILGAVLGLGLIALAAWPALRVLHDVRRQHQALPMLASFEDDQELERWAFQEAAGSRVGEHASFGLFSLRLDLQPGSYPGALLSSPPEDWRSYDGLSFDLFVEGPGRLELVLKIADADHDDSYQDRFHEYLTLEPGPHRIHVPLDRVAEGGGRRVLDLGRIRGVQIFVEGLRRPRTIYVDGLRLVRVAR